MEKKNLILLGVLGALVLIFCAGMAIDTSVNVTEKGINETDLSTAEAGITYSITINCSGIDNKIRIYGMDYIPQGGIQVFELEEGTYSLQGALVGVFAHFEVNSSGVVLYDSTLEGGVFLGEGSSMLTVIGHSITVDATDVDQGICLGHWGYDSFMDWTEPGNTTTYKLVATGQYTYGLETYITWRFANFYILPTGAVFYDNSQIGIIEGNGTDTVKPVGHSITIDATDVDQDICLGHWGYNVFMGWTEPGNTTTYNLVVSGVGTYKLETWITWEFTTFDVLPTGVLFYDNSQVGIIEGNGTNTVKVVGHSITVDATDVDQDICLGHWGYDTFIDWTESGNTTTYNLVASGQNSRNSYKLETWVTWHFASFDVLPTGVVFYDNSQVGIIEGNGTDTVKPVGHSITIDATGVDLDICLGHWTSNGFMGWTEAGNTTTYNLVASGQNSRYTYVLETWVTWHFASFDVLPTGVVFYDNSRVGIIEGNGTDTVKPIGHSITIDATEVDQDICLGHWTSNGFMGWTGAGNTTMYNLVASGQNSRYSYVLETWINWKFAYFDVLPTGVVSYDNSLIGVVRGNNTSILTVIGHPITVDNTLMTKNVSVSWVGDPNIFLGFTEPGEKRTYYLIANTQHAYPVYVENGKIGDFRVFSDQSCSPNEFITAYGTIFINYNYDDEPPATEIILSGTIGYNGWYTSDIQVTLTAIDEVSGVERTEYSFDGSNWIEYSGIFLVSAEGISTIFYRSIDEAGNVEIIKEIDIKIDKTQPDTQLEMSTYNIDLLGDIYITSSTEFSLTASDLTSGVETIYYRINSGAWCEYSSVFTLYSNGLYTIEYYSVDAAGNEESVNSITVNLANFEVNSYLSKGEDDPITFFDIIFTRSKQTGEYKLVATNPGQIFHITEVTNHWLTSIDTLTIEVIIPDDFIMKGSEPIHVYLDGVDITLNCLIEGNLITVQDVPSGSSIKVVVHLDYGLKGMVYANIDDFGMVGYVFETLVSGINGVNGLEQSTQHTATIITHQKKTTAIAGYVYNTNGEFLEGLTVKLYQNGVLIGTTTTDENGFYYFIDIDEGDCEVHVLYDDQNEIQVATASKNELEEVNFELLYDPL